MYRIIDCKQGTHEWLQARLGKISGSIMDRIITKSGKQSASLDDIINRAVAEIIVGEPDETFVSGDMIRGSALEAQALEFYNFVYGFEFKPCGFLQAVSDKGEPLGYGVSPDGIMDLIGLELKCPAAHTHLAYLAKEELPDKYIQQVQAALMVTGFDKWIFGSYHPSFPCVKVEVLRDEKLISLMKPLVLETCEKIQERCIKVREKIGDSNVE
jgi:YqaJ-like viral recombinase domain